MDLVVPAFELINVVALAEAVIFAVVLLATPALKSRANSILAVVFVLIATVKLDQLYQRGRESFREYENSLRAVF